MSSESRSIRLDTDHAVQELMANTVARISRDVCIHVQRECVFLSGATNSWYEKQLVQESLRDISRSYQIHNDIAVAAWN